jgi:hypothetical protein
MCVFTQFAPYDKERVFAMDGVGVDVIDVYVCLANLQVWYNTRAMRYSFQFRAIVENRPSLDARQCVNSVLRTQTTQ